MYPMGHGFRTIQQMHPEFAGRFEIDRTFIFKKDDWLMIVDAGKVEYIHEEGTS